MLKRTYLILTILLLIFSFSTLNPSSSTGTSSFRNVSFDGLNLFEAINMTAVRGHMEYFAGLSTRATGYPGNYLAAEYIRSKFLEYGLKNVSYQEFSVVDAVSHGANVTIMLTGDVVLIHPLLPNLVCPSTTPPEGVTGPLIYVGDGWIEDFDTGAKDANADVEGSIILMDYYTENRWITAAKLGAKAVIFIPPIIPSHGLSGSTHVKALPQTPLNFPRFYVDKQGADLLLQHLGDRVCVVSTQRWEKVKSQNVIGFIEGSQYPDEIVLLSSYYDSYSIAPTAAPGAEESAGITVLLEMARYFAKPENQPKNSVMFAAFGGHHQFLAGSIAFTDQYFSYAAKLENPAKFNFGLKIKLNINLDLSMGFPVLYFSAEGPGFHAFSGDAAWAGVYSNLKNYLYAIIDEVNLQKPFGRTYTIPEYDHWMDPGYYTSLEKEGRIQAWKDFPYDHEPLWACYVPAYTITTSYDPRPQFEEPFDTMQWVDSRKDSWSNLQTQYELLLSIIFSYLHEDDLNSAYVGWPIEAKETAIGRYPYWERIVGKVGVYVKEKVWYDPVPNALVSLWTPGSLTVAANIRTSYHYRRLFTFADEYGRFEFLPTSSRYYLNKIISAWIIDNKTGNVIYAPDMGMHIYASRVLLGAHPTGTPDPYDIGWLAVFKCSALVIFDTVVPSALTLYKPEIGGFRLPIISLYLHDIHVEPEYLGGIGGEWTWVEWPQVTVLFAPPDMPIEVSWLFPPKRYPLALLINATQENPAGYGYTLETGEQLILPMTSLHYAENLYWINEERFSTVSQYEPGTEKSAAYQQQLQAASFIQEAHQAWIDREYSRAELLSLRAWDLVWKAYNSVRPKIEDAASVVPFISFFLLPFVFLAEKLIFNAKEIKRLASFLGLYGFILFAFYFLHPGFQLAANPIMIIIGFSTLILIAPLLFIVFRYVWTFIEVLRRERLGRHEAEISRVSELGYAFITGIEHMRKIKLRTTLTLISIVIMISSIVSIASISSMKLARAELFPLGMANYEGIFIRRIQWGQGSYDLGGGVLQLLEAWYGNEATIAPRAWRYSAFRESVNSKPQGVGFRTYYGDKFITTMVLWGLTPAERELLGVDAVLLGGDWFAPKDRKAIILNKDQADYLGIKTDDVDKEPVPVTFEGMTYYVIGIIDMDFEYYVEMDGERVTPIKFDVVGVNQWVEHVTLDYVLILPYDEVIHLGGGTASISLKFKDPAKVRETAESISSMLSTYLTYSATEAQKEVYMHSEASAYSVWGFEYQTVPMVIVVLAIFNIMLGSVYERKKIISTYSVVGLSPLHIAFMFLAESIVYALLGGVIGYLVAMLEGKLMGIIIPGALVLNYSSGWVLIAVGLSIITTILASLYPMWVASRLVTPSLERAWKIPSKPKGDLWEIPLPFFAFGESEANGIIAYIREYMEAHAIRDAPDFSISSLKLTEGKMEEKTYKGIDASVRLFPYDVGIAQTTQFYLVEVEPERWESRIIAQRNLGPRNRWRRLHRHYVDMFRKQLLLWRSLPPSERQRYAEIYKGPEA